jgi:NAD-dependent SIR2 family protein deacetylase
MNTAMTIELNIVRAAEAIYNADSLIITAGAGMGVDSGLPDFRGKEGFWKAYPALAQANMSFSEIACPDGFVKKPKLAWGFYGHRLNLYRNTQPHIGFRYLRAIANCLDNGAFIFTSNVDGHFQKAGFPLNNIVECHGSIHHMQCQNACNQEIWEATKFTPEVDEEHCLLTSALPTCPSCFEIARPNILMFGDWSWLNWRTGFQKARFHEWRETANNLVVIEIGAGKATPTVREFGEGLNVPLIRINPRDANVSRPTDVSLEMGALAGITAIAKQLNAMGFIKKWRAT